MAVYSGGDYDDGGVGSGGGGVGDVVEGGWCW